MSPAITFRPLTEEDLPLLGEWLHRPHLQRWWRRGMPTLEEVRGHYLPRIRGEDDAHPYLAMLGGEPIGYCQWCDASAGTADWWPDAPAAGARGLDQFLADGERLGRGLGTAMVRAFADFVCADPAVTELRVDPREDNARAIRCYEKAGFRRRCAFVSPDGPSILMVLARVDS